jgi:hypothetical protein
MRSSVRAPVHAAAFYPIPALFFIMPHYGQREPDGNGPREIPFPVTLMLSVPCDALSGIDIAPATHARTITAEERLSVRTADAVKEYGPALNELEAPL